MDMATLAEDWQQIARCFSRMFQQKLKPLRNHGLVQWHGLTAIVISDQQAEQAHEFGFLRSSGAAFVTVWINNICYSKSSGAMNRYLLPPMAKTNRPGSGDMIGSPKRLLYFCEIVPIGGPRNGKETGERLARCGVLLSKLFSKIDLG